MGKIIIKSFFFLLAIVVIAITFLSTVGFETNKFNNTIIEQANKINENIKINFERTKLYLNPKELNLVIKLKKPEILIKKNQIKLSKLDLYLNINAFFNSNFLLKRAEISFVENDIKDIAKVTNIFLPRIINKQIRKKFSEGKLKGDFFIPFNKDGSINKDYGFSGKISNAKINLTNDFLIKNLTAEINHSKVNKNYNYEIFIKEANVYDVNFAGSTINLSPNSSGNEIKTLLHTSGIFNLEKFKKISLLLNLENKFLNNINLKGDLKTNINFNLTKKFKVKNLNYEVNGKIDSCEIQIKEVSLIKEYIPNFNNLLFLKDTSIIYKKSNLKQKMELNGLIKIDKDFDKFSINEKYSHQNSVFDIFADVNLSNTDIIIPKLNVNKKKYLDTNLQLEASFNIKKYYKINSLKFISDKSKLLFSNLKLNEKFEVENFNIIEAKTFLNNNLNNDFKIIKKDNIEIIGDFYDAQPLLRSLYVKNDKKTFSKSFNSNIRANIKKAYTGTGDDVSNFSMISTIKEGSFDKLSLKGDFSPTEIIEMSIYKLSDEKKTLQVISDRARPFIKNFNFIKGFERGKLNYESTISKDITESNLKITDFKVSKVPALASLLTLASLKGIADTLSGEGIHFESFDMQTNSKDNVLNIEEALASGPAVSILLDGYVDKGKTVSLRGTLVPATKLNSIIASIPIVGDILVGKKSGEGVVGVSFKMKGPPNNIKTTVNPIKTLTPRFIVRAVENLKNKKKNKKKSK